MLQQIAVLHACDHIRFCWSNTPQNPLINMLIYLVVSTCWWNKEPGLICMIFFFMDNWKLPLLGFLVKTNYITNMLQEHLCKYSWIFMVILKTLPLLKPEAHLSHSNKWIYVSFLGMCLAHKILKIEFIRKISVMNLHIIYRSLKGFSVHDTKTLAWYSRFKSGGVS